MKKIVFFSYSLNVGGIERALINLLKNIDYNNYKVTLILENKSGELLRDLPKSVNVIEYKISNHKIVLIRKIINRIKLIINIIKNYNKYDFSCCYAPYSIPGSILARYYSKNNVYWIHSDYYSLYKNDVTKFKDFFNKRFIEKFQNIVFVSKEAMDNFKLIYPKLISKLSVCNNLIDLNDIYLKQESNIPNIKPTKTLFLNVSRHDDHSKKITRIIESAQILKKNNIDFEIWLIGDGPDYKLYSDLIIDYDLTKEVIMVGMKDNPYPYYKIADCFLLTSDYEGFPVVYLESAYFKLPIITTIDVSIGSELLSDGYATIVKKDAISIAEAMTEFIRQKPVLKTIDLNLYNESVLNKIYNIIENKW